MGPSQFPILNHGKFWDRVYYQNRRTTLTRAGLYALFYFQESGKWPTLNELEADFPSVCTF